jgi:hypothetical protein
MQKKEGGMQKYPWDKNPDGTPRGPKDDLAAARKLIEQPAWLIDSSSHQI